MKSKKIIKAFKQVRRYCNRRMCDRCAFAFKANDNHLCGLERFNTTVGWEAFQIGAKEVFK